MCHVDDGCGFTDNLIEKCENKCNENISVNTKDNNDDDNFMSDKLVYAKA